MPSESDTVADCVAWTRLRWLATQLRWQAFFYLQVCLESVLLASLCYWRVCAIGESVLLASLCYRRVSAIDASVLLTHEDTESFIELFSDWSGLALANFTIVQFDCRNHFCCTARKKALVSRVDVVAGQGGFN